MFYIHNKFEFIFYYWDRSINLKLFQLLYKLSSYWKELMDLQYKRKKDYGLINIDPSSKQGPILVHQKHSRRRCCSCHPLPFCKALILLNCFPVYSQLSFDFGGDQGKKLWLYVPFWQCSRRDGQRGLWRGLPQLNLEQDLLQLLAYFKFLIIV